MMLHESVEMRMGEKEAAGTESSSTTQTDIEVDVAKSPHVVQGEGMPTGGKKIIPKWAVGILAGFVIVVLGTLNHFYYEWSGDSVGTIWFAASTESTFEHMKLLFWPWVLVFLVSLFLCYYMERMNWVSNWTSNAGGLLVALGLIPALFYLWIEGWDLEESVAYDISIFIIAIIVGIIFWLTTTSFQVDRTFDIILTSLIYIGVFIWMITCSYHSCADIYLDPLASTGSNSTTHDH